jgi:hypothetical protein
MLWFGQVCRRGLSAGGFLLSKRNSRKCPYAGFVVLSTTSDESDGATGLDPATSGVTGQFEGRQVDDGGHSIALFMRPFRAVPERLAWLSGGRSIGPA